MSLGDYNLAELRHYFDEELLRRLSVAPLMKTGNEFVFAFCDKSPMDAQTTLRNTYGIAIRAVFASADTIERALGIMYQAADIPPPICASLIGELLTRRAINYEQAIIARNFKEDRTEAEVLGYMGLLPVTQTSGILQEAI